MSDEKTKLVDAAIAQIEKDYGKGAIMRLGNRDVLVRRGIFDIEIGVASGQVDRPGAAAVGAGQRDPLELPFVG